mmetsp:Transcript_8875/g.26575  ORF Transcript_8875/g.26575 Transcript_8875/m.26575 type:complete len:326 (-) Transcript_8875:338-1315(-)
MAAPQQTEKSGGLWAKQVALLLVIGAATAYSAVRAYSTPEDSGPTYWLVWWYGWLTALSTGLGAAPMLFVKGVSEHLLGSANALAAGMMTSASAALLIEGLKLPPTDGSTWSPPQLVGAGAAAGVLSILASQRLLRGCEDVSLGIMEGVSVRKALLIVVVMTMHSFSEGIGIGVSFGGASPPQLGVLVTTTLAVHNVPEGFAVSVVLVSRGMSVLGAGLWSILTSLPQPLMAIAAYSCASAFVHIQPAGLGFAAGAMLWVAWLELGKDAIEACGATTALSIAVVAGAIMWQAHDLFDEEGESRDQLVRLWAAARALMAGNSTGGN